MHTQTAEAETCQFIDPSSIQASWAHGTLTLRIRGVVNEYPSGVTIQKLPMTLYPPEFAAVDCVPAGIIGPVGHFPYDVSRLFALKSYVETVPVRTSAGTQQVKVERLVEATPEEAAAGAPAVLRRQLSERQAIGFSYNTVNLDSAISDATQKLQQRFPGHVSAKLIESGVVAAGSPVGIFYAYALLEQQGSAQTQPEAGKAARPERSGQIRSAQQGGLLMTAGGPANARGVFLEPQLMGARQQWEALPADGGYLLRSMPADPAMPQLYLTVNPVPGIPGLMLAPLMPNATEQIFDLLHNPGDTQVAIKSRMVGYLVSAASDKPGAPVMLRPAEPGKVPAAQRWEFSPKAG